MARCATSVLAISILDGCFGSVAFFAVWWIRKHCSISASWYNNCFGIETCFAVYWMQKHLDLSNKRQIAATQCSTVPQCWLVVSIPAGSLGMKYAELDTGCKNNVRLHVMVWCVVSMLDDCSILAGCFGSKTCFDVWWMQKQCLIFASWCGVVHQCWLAISVLDGHFGSVTCSAVWWNKKQCMTSASWCNVCFGMITCFALYWTRKFPGLTNAKQNANTECPTLHYNVVGCLNAGQLFRFWLTVSVLLFCCV